MLSGMTVPGGLHARQNLVGDADGVGAFAFGHRKGYGRMGVRPGPFPASIFFLSGRRTGAEKYILVRFLRAVVDGGDIPQVNRTALVDRHDHPADVLRRLSENPPVWTRIWPADEG